MTLPNVTFLTKGLSIFFNAKFLHPDRNNMVKLNIVSRPTPYARTFSPFSFLTWSKLTKIPVITTIHRVIFSLWEGIKHFITLISPQTLRRFRNLLASYLCMAVTFSVLIAQAFIFAAFGYLFFGFDTVSASIKSEQFGLSTPHGFSKASLTTMINRVIGDLGRTTIKSSPTLDTREFFTSSLGIRHGNLLYGSNCKSDEFRGRHNIIISNLIDDVNPEPSHRGQRFCGRCNDYGLSPNNNNRTSVRPERDDIVCSAWKHVEVWNKMPYDNKRTTLQEGMTQARFTWKQYSTAIGITGLEKRSNMGEAAMINLLEAKAMQSEMSLRDRMSVDAFGDGTGNSSKNLTGLAAMIAGSGTYGGINPTTYTWWVSTTQTTSSFAAAGVDDMRTVFNTITFGNDKPDMIFTTQTIHEYYEKSQQPQERYSSNKVADAGFMNLTFKNVPIVFDRDCTSGKIYYCNSRYMSFVVHRDADFSTGPFITPENQDVSTAQILFQGNMTCNNRRKFAVQTVSAA